jgi:hypothetical protein
MLVSTAIMELVAGEAISAGVERRLMPERLESCPCVLSPRLFRFVDDFNN